MNRRSRKIWLSIAGLVFIGLVGGLIIANYFSPTSVKMRLDAMVQRNLPLGSPREKVVDFVTGEKWEVYPDPQRVVAKVRGAAHTFVCRADVLMKFDFASNGGLSSYSSDEFFICL